MSLAIADIGALLALDPAGTPALRTPVGSSAVPVALLPVRLEARFVATLDGSAELLVRVYPDKIHLDAHDPRLSATEVEAGRGYWRAQWRAGADESRLRACWRGLVDRFGPGRAAFLARRLTPTNPEARPSQPLGPEEALDVEPDFPEAGPLAERTSTPVARLLPEKWTACVYSSGALVTSVTGADIPSDLPVGPDLDAAVVANDDGPAVDSGMAWMVDFDEAERQGMGLRVPLPGTALVDARVDVLIVSGIRSGDPLAGAAACADLVSAQRFTDGAAFLAPGTPSNNSADDRSGFVSRDLRGEQSFAAEWRSTALTSTGNAGRTATALGLADSALGHLPGADDDTERLAGAVQAALWPSTWGYYLTQFVGLRAGRLSVEDLEWVRGFSLRWVRPGGPLPAIRIGRQPYGVLPVTSLHRLAATDDADEARSARLRTLLVDLRESVWRPALGDVPRIGRGTDPNAEVIDILRTDAPGNDFAIRRAMGPQYLQHLSKFLGRDLEAIGFWRRLQQMTSRLPADARLGFTPANGGLVWEDETHRLAKPLVPENHAAMIAELLKADLDALAERPPASGLEALLRHSLLRDYAMAAARMLESDDHPLGQLLRDSELVDFAPDQGSTPGWKRQLSQPVSGSTDTVRIRLSVNPPGERSALEELRTTDPSQLEMALRDALGASSHRLDAWATAFATARLAELRNAQPTGLLVGGYGWLENLRFEPSTTVDPLPDEPGPLRLAPDDPGFIHAPSLGQASAAALVRNAHLAHGATADGAYAVSLTSERVRRAQRLFDGVRQGQSLGALLGYDVERALHESGLDRLLDDLRRIAPPAAAESGEEAVRRRILLDGIVLHRRWSDDPQDLLSEVPNLGVRDRPKLIRILQGLDAAVDAAADAVTAENIFQFARGNLARSGGSLDEIASGKAPPPSLEFARTPRTGTTITHRVLIAANPDAARTSAWSTSTPRALVEPTLDRWLSQLIGPATGVDVAVEVLDEGGAVLDRHVVPLTDLGLSALDLVWIAGADAATMLARRAYASAMADREIPVRAARAGGGEEPALRLDLSPSSDRSRRSLADLLELAERARNLVSGTRPLDGADLQPAHAAPDRRMNLDEFEARADAAVTALDGLHAQLNGLLGADPPPAIGDVRPVLAGIAEFGVTGALTSIPGAHDDRLTVGSASTASVAAVLSEAQRRLTEAAGHARDPDVDEPDEARRDRVVRRVRAAFGSGFVACPIFRVPTTADLAASEADPGLLGGDSLAAYTWITRMERIRPSLSRLGLTLREAEILDSTIGLDLRIAQVPHRPGQAWLGARIATEEEGQDGQVSLVLAGSSGVDLTEQLAGLLIDEWTEVVPNRTETTAIAFRYDPPDAAAPHAILLAVPPVMREDWSVGTLTQVLLETLDLAHLRTIGPDQLAAAAQFLPAALLPFNVAGDVPSTDPNLLI
ncbi:hypothetical protein SAMN04487846_2844 [Microbacterium sp. cf046]|uniref:hypothetical protein n=1 Tax=Microbacterium sp. cf046 TaxID=1761803 RepID=UPI0008E3DE9F|nr:hypothetical protein [Microbacterium sp. cf046]SFS14085.1 hypothetical protein SAMN04487846_2844 [Microbacterium sp. cf046]